MKKNFLLAINLLISLSVIGRNNIQNDTLHHLYGVIAGKYGITMNLFIHGPQVNGSMYYNRVGKYIFLSGSIDKTGHLKLVGRLKDGHKTDVFDGLYNGKVYQGTWSSPIGKRTLPFKLVRTNKHWLLLDSVAISAKDSIKVSGQWIYFIDTEHIVYPKAYPIARVARRIDSIVRIYVFDNDLIGIDIYARAKIACFKHYYDMLHQAIADWKEYELKESYDFPTNYELYKNVYTDYLGHLLMRIKVDGYAYTGGAHGYSIASKSLIDLYTGKCLEWEDVFNKPKASFLHEVLVPVMREYFWKKHRLKLKDVIGNINDLEIISFDIGQNGVYFTISQEQYSTGDELMPMPDFFVSFKKLSPYLSGFMKQRLEFNSQR